MEYLKSKIITLLLFLTPLISFGQWSYTFTDPCTLTQQTIQMGSGNSIALNYTSGTTGNPKGVVYHHRGAYLNAIGNTLTWDLPMHSKYLWTLPMFH